LLCLCLCRPLPSWREVFPQLWRAMRRSSRAELKPSGTRQTLGPPTSRRTSRDPEPMSSSRHGQRIN
jgi:hypothetical protein